MEHNLDKLIQIIPPAAEAEDSAPVAGEGERLFRFMVDTAIDQGHITKEGADHVLKALYGGGL